MLNAAPTLLRQPVSRSTTLHRELSYPLRLTAGAGMMTSAVHSVLIQEQRLAVRCDLASGGWLFTELRIKTCFAASYCDYTEAAQVIQPDDVLVLLH